MRTIRAIVACFVSDKRVRRFGHFYPSAIAFDALSYYLDLASTTATPTPDASVWQQVQLSKSLLAILPLSGSCLSNLSQESERFNDMTRTLYR